MQAGAKKFQNEIKILIKIPLCRSTIRRMSKLNDAVTSFFSLIIVDRVLFQKGPSSSQPSVS